MGVGQAFEAILESRDRSPVEYEDGEGTRSHNGDEEAMSLRIERHGLGSRSGGNVLEESVFVGRVLAEDRNVAVTGGVKYEFGLGIEG